MIRTLSVAATKLIGKSLAHRLIGWSIVWLGGLGCVLAQSKLPISSLKHQLTLDKADTSRSRLLYDLGVAYEEVDHDSSVYFLKQSLQLAKRSHHPRITASALYRLGYMYMYYLTDEGHALKWFRESMAIAQKNQDTLNIARCQFYLAILSENQHIGNPDELLTLALANAKKANDWDLLMNIYYMMAVVHQKTDIKRAEQECLLAMQACEHHNRWFWIDCGLLYCEILDEQGKYAQSKAFSQQVGAIAHNLKESEGNYNRMNDLARVETRLENYSAAESMYRQITAFERSKPKPDTFRLVNTFKSILTLYEKEKNYKAAYELSNQIMTLQTRLQEKSITQEVKVEMTKQKATWDLEKKEAEIAVLATQQRQQLLWLIMAVLVALLSIGFVVILRRNQQRIQRQKAELTQLNATKDKLFAVLSHDLRSPVGNLQNNLMLSNLGALSQEELAESTHNLSIEIGYVRTMLENILHWAISQMGGMKAQIKKLDLLPIVDEQIQLLQSTAEGKRIRIINEIPATTQLLADKNHMAVIIRNLLQNALKFSHIAGTIELRSYSSSGKLTIEIADTGVGMSKEMLMTLFALNGHASRSGTANESGAGLGLVLVKELVEANKGQISVESQPGEGTTFRLTF